MIYAISISLIKAEIMQFRIFIINIKYMLCANYMEEHTECQERKNVTSTLLHISQNFHSFFGICMRKRTKAVLTVIRHLAYNILTDSE